MCAKVRPGSDGALACWVLLGDLEGILSMKFFAGNLVVFHSKTDPENVGSWAGLKGVRWPAGQKGRAMQRNSFMVVWRRREREDRVEVRLGDEMLLQSTSTRMR